ncbi:MAG: ATP-binding protein [Myxococcota bacterium]|nr:ATP-binding protein [Myxococcota bacterium]
MMQPHENKRLKLIIIDDNDAIHEDFRKIFFHEKPQSGLEALEASIFGESETSSPPAREGPDFELSFASQGEEGFNKILKARQQGVPYSVAFVDMRMPPGWDGLETIHKIFEVEDDIQIVICTAFADYTWHEILENLGHSDRILILKKPFDPIEVTQLATALGQKWNLSQLALLKLEHLEAMVNERTREIRKTKDELITATQVKDEFLANMSHEMRTPMNGILGFIDILLMDDTLSMDHRDSISIIKESADALMALISQILDVAQAQEGQVESVWEKFSLLGPIHEVVENIQSQFPEKKNLEWRVECDDLPEFGYGDRRRIKQLLHCIIENSIKFTQDGSIDVFTEKIEVNGDLLHLFFCVRDTGVGIPPEKVSQMFEPFRQVDGSLTRKFGGAGLGLTVAKQIVELLDGNIRLESNIGQGTSAYFDFVIQRFS